MAEALDAGAHPAAIAWKIKQKRLAVARRYKPADALHAIGGRERDLFRFWKSGGGRRRVDACGEIHQRALRKENQRSQCEIADQYDKGERAEHDHTARRRPSELEPSERP